MNNFSLLGKGGEKNDCLFPLLDKPIGIGTDPNSCSIIYTQKKDDVSAFHCQLVPKQGGWTLTDYSEKGTWLNGKKITPYQAYPLKPGDVFYLANLENSFRFSADNVDNQGQNINPNQGQTINPNQWQVKSPNQSQTQNPNQWQVQNPNQGQTQNPNQWQFPNPNQGQFQNPNQWQVQNPNQGQFQNLNQETQPQSKWLGIKEKFLTWEGRLNRKPYILRSLCIFVVSWLIQFAVAFILAISGASDDSVIYVSSLVSLPLMIPSTMLAIRRLHDTDHSGWWLFMGLIPIIGWFYMLYLTWFKKGTAGSNRFGSDPLA